MRRFAIIGQRAMSQGKLPLNDMAGGAGRMDVLVRAMMSALMTSHGFRDDTEIILHLQGGPGPNRRVKIDGRTVRGIHAEERSVAGQIGKVLEFEDFYENPNNGYRAYHFLIAVQKDGKTFPVEVQVKTERVKKLAGLSHTVYKRGNLNAKGFNKLNELALKSDKGDKQAQKKFDEI